MPVKRRKPGRRALELATKRLLALRSLTAAGSRMRPSLLASVICSVDSHSFKPEHGLGVSVPMLVLCRRFNFHHHHARNRRTVKVETRSAPQLCLVSQKPCGAVSDCPSRAAEGD